MSPEKLSLRPASAKSSKDSKKKATKATCAPSSMSPETHRIITRARSEQFKFFDLPAELRNRIYSYALQDSEPLSLKDIRVPPLLHSTQQIRSEALGLLTSLNTAKVAVRCNYCVRKRHISGTAHAFFKETGIISIEAKRKEWMVKHAAVFKGLDIDIGCSCCMTPFTIASLSIRYFNGRPSVEGRTIYRTKSDYFKAPFERIGGKVRGVLGEIKMQEKSVGFGYEDLEKLVGCLRISLVKEVVVLNA